MINNIYTIKDKVAEECGPLFQAVNDAVAIRSTIKVLSQAVDPADYALLRIGAYNTETGSICPCEVCQVNFVMSPDRMYVVEGGKIDG